MSKGVFPEGDEPGRDADIPGIEKSPHGLGEIEVIMRDGLDITLADEDETRIHAKMPEKPDPIGDGKIQGMVTGLGGAYCLCCTYSAEECKTPAMIAIGFKINRSIEECVELHRRFPTRTMGDYPDRKGQTQPVISRLNWIHHTAIMHAKIHVLEYLCLLLSRIIANCTGGVDYWYNTFIPAPETREHRSEKTGKPLKNYSAHEHEHIDAAKELVKNHVKKHVHINIFAKGDQMATGNMFEMFSLDTAREKMLEIIIHQDAEEQERMREAWNDIHLDLCALAIVGNSQKAKVEVEDYRDISKRVNRRIVEEFPWAQIPQAVHQLIAHASELMEENDNYGLGGKAEHGLERGNKELKTWRDIGARKTNLYDNLKDTANKMTEASAPPLRPYDAKRTKRHREKKAVNTKRTKLTELVNSLFVGGVAPRGAFESTIHPTPQAEGGDMA